MLITKAQKLNGIFTMAIFLTMFLPWLASVGGCLLGAISFFHMAVTITDTFRVSTSFAGAYPEFYIAFCVACIPVVFNGVVLLNREESKEDL